MPLCHHLGAQQNIKFPFAELVQYLRVGKLAGSGIPVHADNPCLRHQLRQLLLQLFRAGAKILDIGAAALGADLRHRHLDIAVMAQEPPVPVIHQRHGALGAFHGLPAGTAHDKGGKAPPVQHEDNLLMLCQRIGNQILQRQGNHAAPPHPQLLPHIRTGHLGQAAAADALRHGKKPIVTPHRMIVGLQRWGSTAQEQYSAVQLRQLLCHHPGMIPGRLILLVGIVLLLIHDDQPHILKRRKQGGTGPDDNACLAGAHPHDGIISFIDGEAAVHHHDIPGKVPLE